MRKRLANKKRKCVCKRSKMKKIDSERRARRKRKRRRKTTRRLSFLIWEFKRPLKSPGLVRIS